MEKTELKINDMFCQRWVKTKVGTQVDLQIVKSDTLLSFSLIGGILIMLLSMIGCSDTPYGSVLTPKDIDRYIVSAGDSVCLYNGGESSCLKLRPRRSGGAANNTPIIHVHPRKLVYMFYYEGKQIVHAERVIDTTEIVQALQSQTPANNQSDDVNNPPSPPVVRNPPSPPVVRNSPPPPVVRNTPPNNGGGNNGGGNNGGGNNGGGNNGGGNNGGNQQPVTRTATTLRVFSGGGQSAETGEYLTYPLIVEVLDQNSAVLSGVPVTFSEDDDGMLGSTSATTGADGQASTTLQLGGTAGTYTVTASVTGLTSVTFTATATEPLVATTLAVFDGDNQEDETGQLLEEPLIVEVLDQNSAVLPGVPVTFSEDDDGTLSSTSAITGSNGRASTLLRLGSTAGTYTVTASVPNLSSVTFTATATAPPPPPPATLVATTLQYVDGRGQSAQTGQPLMNPLIVKVLDQNSAPLSDVLVTFSEDDDGMLGSTSATTGADGKASTTLRLGSTAGTYTVTASVPNLSSVTFTATATAPPRAARMQVFSGNNQSKEAYQYLPEPLIVKVWDQYNDPFPNVEVSFIVDPTSGVLNPASDTTDSDGKASTILRFSSTTGTYTVTVTATGITQMVRFTATATARPTDSDWAQQSHYYDAQHSSQGWLVWMYYPKNYQGPRGLPDGLDDADFLTNGFMLIPSNGVTITEFVQTEVACWDPDKPCNSRGPGDPSKQGVPTSYSVQLFLTMPAGTGNNDVVTFDVIWDRSAANWWDDPDDSLPRQIPPDMTYSLMASKNMMDGQEGADLDHTQQ